jgi:hypothetical protein
MKSREVKIVLANPSMDVAFHEAMKEAREIAPSVYEFKVALTTIQAEASRFGNDIDYVYHFMVYAEEFYKEEE